MPKSKEAEFDAADVELLTSVIEAIPNLADAAHAAKLVRKRLKYPIKDRAEMLTLFEGKKSLRLGKRGVTPTLTEEFLPEKFFPIESERDLICKLLIAFQIGDIYHTEELMRKAEAQDEPAALLPGPAYQPGGYSNLRRQRKESK